jgi:hypothetical protein
MIRSSINVTTKVYIKCLNNNTSDHNTEQCKNFSIGITVPIFYYEITKFIPELFLDKLLPQLNLFDGMVLYQLQRLYGAVDKAIANGTLLHKTFVKGSRSQFHANFSAFASND